MCTKVERSPDATYGIDCSRMHRKGLLLVSKTKTMKSNFSTHKYIIVSNNSSSHKLPFTLKQISNFKHSTLNFKLRFHFQLFHHVINDGAFRIMHKGRKQTIHKARPMQSGEFTTLCETMFVNAASCVF